MGAGVVGLRHEGEGSGAERRLAVWVAVDPGPILGAPSVEPAAFLIGAGVVLYLTKVYEEVAHAPPRWLPFQGIQ